MKNSLFLFMMIISSMFLGAAIVLAMRPANPAEYQFIVTDDSVQVFDNQRVIGTIKLEGQLDSLITLDNQ